jgi:hypothetical protein
MVRGLSLLTTALLLLSAASAGAQEDFARNGPYLGVSGLFGRPRFNDDARSSLNDYLATQPFDLEIRPGVWETLVYTVDTEMKGSFGIGGVVGYRLHRFVSAEVEGEWLLAFDGDVALTGPSEELPQGQSFLPEIATTEFEIASVTANLKAHLLTGLWQPYLLVGGGMLTVKGEVRETGRMYETDLVDDEEVPKYPNWPGIEYSQRDTDFAMRFGGGLDVYSFGTDSVVITAGADYVLPFGDVEDFDYVSINVGVLYRF